MFTKIAFTSLSSFKILRASVNYWPSAEPPTSRKLAGEPPYIFIISIVDIARPAPLTKQPILPPM
jgi:hypothetical protein